MACTFRKHLLHLLYFWIITGKETISKHTFRRIQHQLDIRTPRQRNRVLRKLFKFRQTHDLKTSDLVLIEGSRKMFRTIRMSKKCNFVRTTRYLEGHSSPPISYQKSKRKIMCARARVACIAMHFRNIYDSPLHAADFKSLNMT